MPEKKEKPLLTRMVGGSEIEVPIEEVWDSLCKVIRLAWLVTCPNQPEYLLARLHYLHERLADLEGITFNYKRRLYGSNIGDEIIRLPKEIN